MLMASGRTAGDVLKDPMKLRITAETRLKCGVEHCQALAGAIYRKKFFYALAVSKIYQGDPGLLFEKAAQTMRA